MNNAQGGEAMGQVLTVAVIDLGPNNVGSLGPAGRLDSQELSEVVADLGAEAYSLPASNRWKCVDGRCSATELDDANTQTEADPQTAGSLPVTETAISYMGDPAKHQPKSSMIAQKTREAIADGLEIVMHGDEHKGKGGCLANAEIRTALRFNAENADIMAPQVWAASQEDGLDQWINQDDVMVSIINGHEAANNDELWDCTPEEAVDIAIANGAQYEELLGSHQEVADREDRTDRGFAKARFVLDHATVSEQIQTFSVSAGRHMTEVFRRAEGRGQTKRDAALETMRAKLFNRGVKKMLIAQDTPVAVVTYS